MSNIATGGPLSCRVQLQPQLNTPGPANKGLTRHTRNVQAGVLRQALALLWTCSRLCCVVVVVVVVVVEFIYFVESIFGKKFVIITYL